MLAVDEDDDFCKTTLSAMILDYPPPTIVNLYAELEDAVELEKARLEGVLRYLSDGKKINDQDLVLVVDGKDTWFQLPSEVIIQQYQNMLKDADGRLARNYVGDVTQTIVFGAVKTCEDEDLACKHFPPSVLPGNVYGRDTGNDVQHTPAKYLDSKMLMGPAEDLRLLYETAVKVFEEKKSPQATVQSVMASIFAEQQMARNSQHRRFMKVLPSKWLDYFGGLAAEVGSDELEQIFNTTLGETSRHEFKIGIDYTHTLFQPLGDSAPDELIPLIHDSSIDPSQFHHSGMPTPSLTIPSALQQANLPFWTPDIGAHNPSPNGKSAHIDKLEINGELDHLEHRDTTWDQIKLVQNTYTGAIPAVFHVDNRSPSKIFQMEGWMQNPPVADITWNSLWYATYERALLRKYFRNSQSSLGYHTAAIGGDRLWDTRGGRGGVWTEKEELWLPWGEVDGVCGSVKKIRNAFADEKGVWLHELDEGMGEEARDNAEAELREYILEKEKEAMEKEEERLREEEGNLRKEEEEKESEVVQLVAMLKMKGEERKKAEEDALIKAEEDARIKAEEEEQRAKEEEERDRVEREREQKAYEEGQDLLE